MEQNGRGKKIVTALVALAIAAVFFFAGFAVARLTKKREVSSFEWAMKIVGENYYKDVTSGEFLNGSLKGLADSLDPYCEYYTAAEYKKAVASNSGKKSGVGVSFTYVGEGVHPQNKSGILIESVVGNSPAYKSGLRAGEFISSASCGGEPIPFDSAADFSSFIDARADGENFTLYSDRGEYQVAKSAYTQSYCYMATNSNQWDIVYENNMREIKETDSRPEFSCLPDGAAYLRLDQFFGNAANEMAELIGIFNAENCTSLILDLRGNGGGYVNVMSDISGIFTGQLENANPISMRAVYRDGHSENSYVTKRFAAEKQLPAGTKVSVLADNGTASASEALIGVLIDNNVIDYEDIYISDFGDKYMSYLKSAGSGAAEKNKRTYGKGIMQSTFVNRRTGEALKLTTAQIYWPDKTKNISIHDVGLNAKMGCKTVPTEWDVTFGDTQLDDAVKEIYG